MPARSVVIEKLTKFTGERHELLTPGEYTQLAGRAGRRGIDEVGYAVVCWNPFVAVRAGRRPRIAAHVRAHVVVPRRPTTWRSTSCGATTGTSAPPAEPLVRAVPRRPRRRGARPPARAHPGAARARQRDFGAGTPRRRRGVPRAAGRARRRPPSGPCRPGGRLEQLRPGDVVMAPGPAPWSCCARTRPLRQPGARAHPAAHDGAVAPDDFPGPDAASPPSSCRARTRRRTPASIGRGRDAAAPARPSTPTAGRRRPASRMLEARVQARTLCDRAAGTARRAARRRQAERIDREATRLERRIVGPHRNLARSSTACSGPRSLGLRGRLVAHAERATMLARLYTEGDLVSRRRMRRACSTASSPPRSPPIVSCFAYERRGPDSDDPCRRAGGRTRSCASASSRSNASGRTSDRRSATHGCPRPASPTPASPPRSTVGARRRARRHPRRRGDDRRRLRAQRQAGHRPPPPGRRRRARTRDRRAPAPPPTIAAAAWSPLRARSPSRPSEPVRRDRAQMIKPGEPWGSPTSSPPDFEVAGGDADARRAVAGAPGPSCASSPTPPRPRPRRRAAPGRAAAATGHRAPRRRAPPDRSGSIGACSPCNMCVVGTPPDRLRWSSRAVAVERARRRQALVPRAGHAPWCRERAVPAGPRPRSPGPPRRRQGRGPGVRAPGGGERRRDAAQRLATRRASPPAPADPTARARRGRRSSVRRRHRRHRRRRGLDGVPRGGASRRRSVERSAASEPGAAGPADCS